jgi:hypothetical protein
MALSSSPVSPQYKNLNMLIVDTTIGLTSMETLPRYNLDHTEAPLISHLISYNTSQTTPIIN